MVSQTTYILGNDVTVQGLLGTKPEAQTSTYYKVYPVVAPQGTTAPYIVVSQQSKINLAHDNCGYEYSIQVVSYAKSYDEVTELNDAVISALRSQTNGTVNGLPFGFEEVTNESDGFDKDNSLYAKITTFNGNA